MNTFRQHHLEFIQKFMELNPSQGLDIHRLFTDFLSFLYEDEQFASLAKNALSSVAQPLYNTHHHYPIVIETPYLSSYRNGNHNFNQPNTIGLFSSVYHILPSTKDLHEIVLCPYTEYISDAHLPYYLKKQRRLFDHSSSTKDYLLLRLDGSVSYVPEKVSSYFQYTMKSPRPFYYLGGRPMTPEILQKIMDYNPYEFPIQPLDTPDFIKHSL